MMILKSASSVLPSFITVLDVEGYYLGAVIEFEKPLRQSWCELANPSIWESEQLRWQTSGLQASCGEGRL